MNRDEMHERKHRQIKNNNEQQNKKKNTKTAHLSIAPDTVQRNAGEMKKKRLKHFYVKFMRSKLIN